MITHDTGAFGIGRVPASAPGALTCGTCGRAWTLDITPAGRCPWEVLHGVARPSVRSIIATMREAAAMIDPARAVARVELSRAYGRRRYLLHVTDVGDHPMWDSCPVLFDRTRCTLWVRPARTPASGSDVALGPVQSVLAQLRGVQRAYGTPMPWHAVTPEHQTYRLDVLA